jgi:hypothetical protein
MYVLPTYYSPIPFNFSVNCLCATALNGTVSINQLTIVLIGYYQTEVTITLVASKLELRSSHNFEVKTKNCVKFRDAFNDLFFLFFRIAHAHGVLIM